MKERESEWAEKSEALLKVQTWLRRRSKNEEKRTSEKQRRGRRGSGETRCLFHPLMLHQWMCSQPIVPPFPPFSMPGSSDTHWVTQASWVGFICSISLWLRATERNTNRTSFEEQRQVRLSACLLYASNMKLTGIVVHYSESRLRFSFDAG